MARILIGRALKRTATEQALLETGNHTLTVRHAFEDQWVNYCLRRHADGLLVAV